MSKLIVEMDMPKACPCDLIGVGYAMCCSASSGIPKRVAEYDECVKNGTRPDWCPIKGVLPDEHGDLIDRSLLRADLAGVILWHRGLGIDEVIARQPAIIAEERRGER